MSDENNTSITPYMLTLGPVMLLGAFILWPAADYVGSRGMESLANEADSLMPLLIVASLGTMVMFGGLYLLNAEMMENSEGMHKQLLTVGSMLIIASLVAFIMGMGSNVAIINEADATIDPSSDAVVDAYVDQSDLDDSLNNMFDAGSVAWQMSPVTWGLALIIIGFVAFQSGRQDGPMGLVFPALMPIGTMFLSAPIIDDPAWFNIVFPVTILTHVLVGGLMVAGKLNIPE